MRVIHRDEQGGHSSKMLVADTFFDGEPIPREIVPQAWLREGTVHHTKVLTKHLNTTRYLIGPQVSIIRDDIRRTTWAAVVDESRLLICEVSGPRPYQFPPPRSERKLIAEGEIWRYHLALNKFTGHVSIAWIDRSESGQRLFLDGRAIDTTSKDVDFPCLEFCQVPVGRIQKEEPRFGILTYKCRNTGSLFLRRLSQGTLGPEIHIHPGPTVGGASLAISRDRILVRFDLVRDGKLAPTLMESTDGGLSFSDPRPVDLTAYDGAFTVVPGCTAPIVDKGYNLHVPIFVCNGRESAALNYVVQEGALVEAIRVAGSRPLGSLERFPSTVGNRNPHGNGISDGHGLIMVLGTEGRLYSSNSSAGGIYFPDCMLLNHEMPKIAAFDASECYSSGLRANYVSMDYLYVEADSEGRPVSPILHIETWDMPLPIPGARAHARGSEVLLSVLNDADLEPGKVVFGFDDPNITITDVKITDLRNAVISTDSTALAGKRISFDVHTLFHRHYGEAVVEARSEPSV